MTGGIVAGSTLQSEGGETSPTKVAALLPCRGRTGLFFGPHGEGPRQRQRREDKARAVCLPCPLLGPCRSAARARREYGFWGGESEEDRARAGYPVAMPIGRLADLIRDWRRSEVS